MLLDKKACDIGSHSLISRPDVHPSHHFRRQARGEFYINFPLQRWTIIIINNTSTSFISSATRDHLCQLVRNGACLLGGRRNVSRSYLVGLRAWFLSQKVRGSTLYSFSSAFAHMMFTFLPMPERVDDVQNKYSSSTV